MKLLIAEQYQEFLKGYKIDVRQLLLDVGIQNPLVDETVEISLLENYLFLSAIDQAFSEEMIREICQLEHSHLFVPTFLASVLADDGYGALRKFVEYQSFLCPNECVLEETDDALRLSIRYPENLFPLPKFAILFTHLSLLAILRKGSGRKLRPIRIESPYAYNQDTEEWLGRSVTLTRETNAIVFLKEDLSWGFRTHSKKTLAYLQDALDRELSEEQFGLSTRLQLHAVICRMLQDNRLTVGNVAQEMGMSVRSLQRRLGDEGISYQEELQSVRLDLAVYYLKQGASTEEIAEKLGYTELAAFSRAFKKWTGQTLSDYRKHMDLA